MLFSVARYLSLSCIDGVIVSSPVDFELLDYLTYLGLFHSRFEPDFLFYTRYECTFQLQTVLKNHVRIWKVSNVGSFVLIS
jgi:hypothetical protein